MRQSNGNEIGWKEVAFTVVMFAAFYCIMWLASV